MEILKVLVSCFPGFLINFLCGYNNKIYFYRVYKMIREIVFLTWIAITLAGCIAVASPPPPTIKTPTAIPAPTLNPSPFPTVDLSQYVFPTTFNPAKRYLFYLHGKIIEDQGLPAVSPDF